MLYVELTDLTKKDKLIAANRQQATKSALSYQTGVLRDTVLLYDTDSPPAMPSCRTLILDRYEWEHHVSVLCTIISLLTGVYQLTASQQYALDVTLHEVLLIQLLMSRRERWASSKWTAVPSRLQMLLPA